MILKLIPDPFDEPEPECDMQGVDTDDGSSLDQELDAFVWWVVAFTCVFQTFHSLSSRAAQWLLMFNSVTLTFLGKFSEKIAYISRTLPSTIYRRAVFLKDYVTLSSVKHYVVCRECHALSEYENCLENRGTRTIIKCCRECLLAKKQFFLLKIVTSKGTRKFYPHHVFPYNSLISSLQMLIKRPGFLAQCKHWRQSYANDDRSLTDMYDGEVWKKMLCFEGTDFLSKKNSIAFMLNIDWFQPFKHRTYSVGVIYLAVVNLPREVHFERENIIVVGLLPGPSEPSKNMPISHP